MQTTATILSIVLAVSFLGSGAMKVLGQSATLDGLNTLGIGRRTAAIIGVLEVAAAAGLVIGLAVRWVGVAAVAGLVLLMLGAVLTHVRAGDYADGQRRAPALMPVFLTVLTGATLALLVATA